MSNSTKNLSLFLRIKPSQSPQAFLILPPATIQSPPPIKSYTFDQIFPSTSSQQAIYQQTALPLIMHFLSGYNATYFVYGQTGTGKTYTMGLLDKLNEGSTGIVSDSLREIYKELNQGDEIRVSFMQVYMEEIRDLLNPEAKGLVVREDTEKGINYVKDLVVTKIENIEKAFKIINAGLVFRKMGSQKINQTSSRSHTVLTLYLKKRKDNDTVESTLSFVDLAGSERVKKSASNGTRLEEAKAINSSLSSLAHVIGALSENHNRQYIPFRDSKLTRVLQNSLSGDAKVVFLATIANNNGFLYESIGTLNFAMTCKDLHFKPHIQIIAGDLENSENYEKYEVLEENNEKSMSNSSDNKGETLTTFLIKILKGFEKFITNKPDSYENKDFIKKINEFSMPGLKYNLDLKENHISGLFFKYFEEFDDKYSIFERSSDDFPKKVDENYIKGASLDEILQNINKLADFLVQNIKKILDFHRNFKLFFAISRILQQKRSEELENWSLCLQYSLNRLREAEENQLKQNFPSLSQLEKDLKLKDIMSFEQEKYRDFLNKDDFYLDFDFFDEKFNRNIQKNSCAHKIKDFSLMESLKTIERYSSNKLHINDNTKNNENIYKKDKIIAELYEQEEMVNKLKTPKSEFNKNPMQNTISKKNIKITLNVNDLSEIKKNKLKIDENQQNLRNSDFHQESDSFEKSPKLDKSVDSKKVRTPIKATNSMIKLLENEILKELKLKKMEGDISPINESEQQPSKSLRKSDRNEIAAGRVINDQIKNDITVGRALTDPRSAAGRMLSDQVNPPINIKIISPISNDNEKLNSFDIVGEDSSPINEQTTSKNDEGNGEVGGRVRMNSSSELKPGMIIPPNIIKSVFDRNSIRTRQNTIQLKERGSSIRSPKSPLGKHEELKQEPIKKKSEINSIETLEKALDLLTENCIKN